MYAAYEKLHLNQVGARSMNSEMIGEIASNSVRSTPSRLVLATVFASAFLVCILATIARDHAHNVERDSMLDKLAKELLVLDSRARAAAKLGMPITIGVDHECRHVVAGRERGGGVVSVVPYDSGVEVSLKPLDSVGGSLVRFDCAGRSPDYIVRLHVGEETLRVAVCGLTGWMTAKGVMP